MIDETVAGSLLGFSPAMVLLRRMIVRVGPSLVPVMIEGPTGAGKELVAQAIHLASGCTGEFVAFNVCAIAETIFEDALFGHVRGAFTGATAAFDGYLAQGHQGTVFLDEIGGLAANLQPKLLRAVETKCFRPIGSRADRRSDFRVVAASNQPLVELVNGGGLRVDLAERLCGFVVRVPALADRAEDIPMLAYHFLATWSRELARDAPKFSEGALKALQEYDWPRNVRELRNVVVRLATLVDGSVICVDDVRVALSCQSPAPKHCQDQFLQRRLLTVLAECGGDTVAASRRLGVHRATLYRRLRRLGLPFRAAELAKQVGLCGVRSNEAPLPHRSETSPRLAADQSDSSGL